MTIGSMRFAAAVATSLSAGAALMPATGSAAELVVTAADRAALSLTIYGQGRAQVRDRRIVPLPATAAVVAFEDVSRAMDPTTVIIDGPAGLTVAQQSFQRELITQDALLRHAIGKKVRVVRSHPTTGADIVEEATVLAVDGGLVLRIGDRIETGVPGRIVFDSVPADLRVRPTLLAEMTAPAAGQAPLTLSYLTDGLSWQADYAIIVDEGVGGTTLHVDGRATIANASGTAFDDATLQLVAGEARRVAPPMAPAPVMRTMKMEDSAGMGMAQELSPESLGDLHLYAVPGKISLADQETKQVGLLGAPAVAAERRYISMGHVSPGVRPGPGRETHPQVRLRFANDAGGGLGEPLPAGTARVYERDSQGQPRFVGEDRVEHTPTGGKVELTIGEAFDLTVKRTQTDYSGQGRPLSSYDSSWRVDIANAKDKPETVEIVETIAGSWEVIAESQPHSREDASQAVWKVTVPANGSATLTYRITSRLDR